MEAAAIVTEIRARLESELAPPRNGYLPLVIDNERVGWIDALRARRLAAFADVFALDGRRVTFVSGITGAGERTAAMDRVARVLAVEGRLTAWRDERYAVAAELGAPAFFELERAAARYFGIHTFATHVNGLVRHDDQIRMWLARRSPGKAIDPGLLDNLVGGGIAAGATPRATIVKEAWEEAGIPATVAATALPADPVHICRAQPDGLQRETIFVHDLWLAADFTPTNNDGEVVEFRLATVGDVARLAANRTGPDVITGDASLVIVDCLMRHGVIAPESPDYPALAALRHPALDPSGEEAVAARALRRP